MTKDYFFFELIKLIVANYFKFNSNYELVIFDSADLFFFLATKITINIFSRYFIKIESRKIMNDVQFLVFNGVQLETNNVKIIPK